MSFRYFFDVLFCCLYFENLIFSFCVNEDDRLVYINDFSVRWVIKRGSICMRERVGVLELYFKI